MGRGRRTSLAKGRFEPKAASTAPLHHCTCDTERIALGFHWRHPIANYSLRTLNWTAVAILSIKWGAFPVLGCCSFSLGKCPSNIARKVYCNVPIRRSSIQFFKCFKKSFSLKFKFSLNFETLNEHNWKNVHSFVKTLGERSLWADDDDDDEEHSSSSKLWPAEEAPSVWAWVQGGRFRVGPLKVLISSEALRHLWRISQIVSGVWSSSRIKHPQFHLPTASCKQLLKRSWRSSDGHMMLVGSARSGSPGCACVGQCRAAGSGWVSYSTSAVLMGSCAMFPSVLLRQRCSYPRKGVRRWM